MEKDTENRIAAIKEANRDSVVLLKTLAAEKEVLQALAKHFEIRDEVIDMPIGDLGAMSSKLEEGPSSEPRLAFFPPRTSCPYWD